MAAGAGILMLASSAAAQQRLFIDNGDDGGAPALTCTDIATCNSTTDCASASTDLGLPLVCSNTLLGGGGQCLLSSNARTELICCGTGGIDTCPTRLGAQGVCTPIAGSQVSVCLYPDLFPVCPDPTGTAITVSSVSACFQLPGSTNYTVDWRKGDCDRDGVPNDSDCYPCDHTRFQCPDAGVPDAGTGEPDAGIGSLDGGANSDAAANPSPPSFRGNGGCKCSAVGGGNPASEMAPILLLLAFVWLQRRRWR